MAGVGGGSLLSPDDWNILGTKVQGIPQLELVLVLVLVAVDCFSVDSKSAKGRLGKRRDPPVALSPTVLSVSFLVSDDFVSL